MTAAGPAPGGRHRSIRNPLKTLLVVAYLAAGYSQYQVRLTQLSESSVVAALLYAGLVGLLSMAVVAAAFTRSGVWRWTLAAVFSAAAAFWETNLRVTGEFLTYDAFVSELDALSFLDEALSHYRWVIVRGAVLASLVLIGIGLRPAPQSASAIAGRRSQVWRALVASAPVTALLLLTTLLYVRGGDGGRGLPGMFTPLAYLNLLAYEGLTQAVGPREPVRLPRDGRAAAHDIVLIVDESVSGNYLDINAEHGVPTPLSRPPGAVDVINFGYAAAVTNCSTGVNVTLRHGGTRADYARINARMPSIWQYARAAGLATVFIDAQRTGGMLINRMTRRELADIDRWIQFDEVPVRDRDMAVADTLATLFADQTPQFVFVNKMGAHFPVHDKAPDAFVKYQPALPRGAYAEVGDTDSRLGLSDGVSTWALYRNSYRNTLLWSVGEFFTRLFGAGGLDNAVVIYTSDHGQDLHERGTPGLNTHCGENPVMEEGLVPLVVLQGAGLTTLDWRRHLADNRDRSSHFNIFPTLLQLMGYRLDAVRAVYGNPLTVPTDDPFTFNSRFNARLGTEPRWEFIDLRRIVTPGPPEEDGGQGLAGAPEP